MNIAELITKLAAAAGIDTSDPGMINVLSSSEINKVNVPDSISGKLLNGLLSVESAKNNPDIKSHYVAQALNGVDGKISAALDILGFDETEKSKILAETNTYNRIQLLSDAAKIKMDALKAAKAKGGSDENIEKLKNEVLALNSQIKKLGEDHAEALASKDTEHNNNLLNLNIRSLLSGKKYATDSLKISKELILDSAQKAVLAALETKGAKAVLDSNNQIKLVQKDNPEMPFMEANSVVKFQDLMDTALADQNLLAVTDPNNGGDPPPNPPLGGGKEGFINDEAIASIDSQIAALQG